MRTVLTAFGVLLAALLASSGYLLSGTGGGAFPVGAQQASDAYEYDVLPGLQGEDYLEINCGWHEACNRAKKAGDSLDGFDMPAAAGTAVYAVFRDARAGGSADLTVEFAKKTKRL